MEGLDAAGIDDTPHDAEAAEGEDRYHRRALRRVHGRGAALGGMPHLSGAGDAVRSIRELCVGEVAIGESARVLRTQNLR
jgi:hypothetical protein